MKKDGATQFVPENNANTFKDFHSELARNLVRKWPVVLYKFNNNSTKQYFMNIEKNIIITLNYAMQHWKILNRFYIVWTHPKPPFEWNVFEIFQRLHKSPSIASTESCKFVNKTTIFISRSIYSCKIKAPI